jgi:hypothetical protein
MTTRKTRKEKREIAADEIAREVRYQMAAHGGIKDNVKLFTLTMKWLKFATKTKYKRP